VLLKAPRGQRIQKPRGGGGHSTPGYLHNFTGRHEKKIGGVDQIFWNGGNRCRMYRHNSRFSVGPSTRVRSGAFRRRSVVPSWGRLTFTDVPLSNWKDVSNEVKGLEVCGERGECVWTFKPGKESDKGWAEKGTPSETFRFQCQLEAFR